VPAERGEFGEIESNTSFFKENRLGNRFKLKPMNASGTQLVRTVNKSMMKVLQHYADQITHIHDVPETQANDQLSPTQGSNKNGSPRNSLKNTIKKKRRASTSHKNLLYIKIFKAKFSRDTELTGEMDPFIKIKYQGN
jgi:hypothetical protein